MKVEQPMMLQRAVDMLDFHTLERLITNIGLNRKILKERYTLMLPPLPLRSV